MTARYTSSFCSMEKLYKIVGSQNVEINTSIIVFSDSGNANTPDMNNNY